MRTRQTAQRTIRSLTCGWFQYLAWTCGKSRAADRMVTPSMAALTPTVRPGAGANWTSGPDWYSVLEACRSADQDAAEQSLVNGDDTVADDSEMDVNAAAVAAYRASLDTGAPLSERKLAAMFGKTSRRWARNRVAEAAEGVAPATATQ
ncbi:MAG TPA: hypothetical protein VF933_23715 [Streptosporangiaceae bacterium]